MITINGEKELIRVESWTDIESRPGFDGKLDPGAHELAAIIGNYVFADKIHCGLSNCRTLHGRGYLVATKDGRITNIGKDCGRLYFGVDFDTMSRQFDRDIAAKENRERLWSFLFRLEDVAAAVQAIRQGEDGKHGADWVYKRSRALVQLNQGCPDLVVRRVVELLKTGSDLVMVQREATVEEAARADAAAGRRVPRPHYVEGSAGRISHLHALASENDLREILIVDLESRMKDFSAVKIDSLTPSQLNQWVKWTGTVDQKLEQAVEATGTGRALLSADNLAPLAAVLERDEDLALFQAYLKSLADD